jgi:hypothetical protein
MREKRSLIKPERLQELKAEGSVYTITCSVTGCPCDMTTPGCERGFFSLFVQAIYGIDFAQRLEMPYYVDFGNCRYQYTDAKKEDGNFWNYYFEQPLTDRPDKAVINSFYEVFPLRIWNKKHIKYLYNEVVKHLQFKQDVREILDVKKSIFDKKNILGIQIRCTDHADEILPVKLAAYFKAIDSKLDKYDKLFVATDDSKIIELLQERYGDKLLYNPVVRSINDLAVHTNPEIKDRYQLGLDVLVDCYCLSLCKSAILVHSNISYAALLFNPDLPHVLLERGRVKQNRLKTLLLYHLNELGIRKW